MHEEIQSFTEGGAATTNHGRRMLNPSCRSDQERTVEAFERLSSGGSLEIVTSEPMAKLVAELQARRGISFYWWPLEPMTLFERHCCKEEAILYPLMDIVFNSAEERELISLLQEFEI